MIAIPGQQIRSDLTGSNHPTWDPIGSETDLIKSYIGSDGSRVWDYSTWGDTFFQFSPPHILQSDNGREFVNELISSLQLDFPGNINFKL
ncbi:unnamed protein product [Adineta ricciae]|uniref:Uncharacterized protein n=1 Tax=Adineta ricciae TaxID=249248 RepID=A0A814W5U4_ADIRI|nr:unnamed protein product [Adineta ricciae]CAF1623455.1 unnamed protein product [Adineta ricciae]